MMNFKNDNRGLIKWILIIIIAIIVLSYFGFDLRSIIESDQTQGNLGYVWGGVVMVWDTYLSQPILYFWHNIFIDLIWDAFVENMERIKDGQPTTIQDMVPQLPS
ncbi:MAG: hypothetical protein U9P50_02730 [Patescibacteria group bacterium]|nr:hypothetical protein [Patescibacteria group bacterium]